MLENHKLKPATLISDSITYRDYLLANVEFMLYMKGNKPYAYIHSLSILNTPSPFPLISR